VDILPFIIVGLVTGGVYGLAGVGLVLTYRTSGVFNFSHGSLAAVSAYVFYTFYVQLGVGWPLAAAISVLVLGPLMGLLLERLARAIGAASLALQVAATVGVLLAVEAAIVLIYGQTTLRIVPGFPAQGQVWIGGLAIPYTDIITLAVAAVTTLALSLFVRATRLGMAMRAAVDDPILLDLTGTNPITIRRYAWILGVVLVAVSGVLFAPLLALDPVWLTLLVVQAFGAAAIGGFTSLPLTFGGGLCIGVLASLSTKFFTSGMLAGIPPALPFIVLFLVMLVFPRRQVAERKRVVPVQQSNWTAPLPLQVVAGATVLAFLVAVPTFAGIHLADWTAALAAAVLFLSLGLLVRTSGQVSLGHVAFAAIGVTTFSHLASDARLPWLFALVIAGLAAAPVGAILAIPAIRLTGLHLALTTFGFGVLLAYMFYTTDAMFGSTGAGLTVPRPHLSWLSLDSDHASYFLVLLFALLATALVVALNHSRLGRLLRAMAEVPTALATSGAAVNVTRVLVFCISAFLAAVAGALVGMAQGTVSVDSYHPLLSLKYLALMMIVVGGPPWHALLASAGVVLVPSYITSTATSYWLQLLFGVVAVLFALVPEDRRQAPESLRSVIDSVFRRDPGPTTSAVGARISVRAELVPPGALEVQRLTVLFDGLVAVDGISLHAPTGRITGLIGPNGAGKTTTFNVCSGLMRPSAGRVLLDDRDVSRSGPSARARRGLGRTFQQTQLCESQSVWENTAIGREGVLAGSNPLTHLLAHPVDARLVRDATTYALEFCNLAALAEVQVASLSTGQRRLVELARCLAGPYKILLLDEPSSGLDRVDRMRFGELLLRVVEERGVGILMVEHDMSLVLRLCHWIYVMDFGRMIFQGTPEEVRRSAAVRSAYLATDRLGTNADRKKAVLW
jgi:ABC-type branched-subunit amino acid transport system ATPase component/branched-subunit amino acid ABC-type transport system permease component